MNWHKFFATIALIGFCGFVNAQSVLNREHINLDADWKFHFGHAADATKDFNYSIANIFSKSGAATKTCIDPKFNDSSWRKLDLPHDWAVELPFVNVDNFDVESHGFKPVGGLFPETSIGWYRKKFTVSKAEAGKRFQLQFDGVFRNANFWLNGFYLGNNQSGYVGISYDVTDYLNFDKENILTVRVDATQYEGWFYEGAGIYRHVWLNKYNSLHVAEDGVFAYSKIAGNNATVTVENTINNENFDAANCTVKTLLLNRNNQFVQQSVEQKIVLSSKENKTIKQTIAVANPVLWSVDNPYLYSVVTIVSQNGKEIDRVTKRFGIRSIEIKTNGVFLNGKHVKIQGVNCHQDHAGVGSALPDYLQYYRVQELKKFGVNAYRTSHHAATPELLDACDSLGMLVLSEQRLLNSSPEYMNQLERLIKRDRNRACVFLWSIGNEEGWIQKTETGKKIAQTLIAKQKELDPTRTCTYAADVDNYYKGVNEVIPVRGFNYRQYAVADYHRDHPNQPCIGTEMGSTVSTRGIYEKDSINAYVPDQDIIAPWWASTAETWWTLASPNDFWLGGFVWTGFDYRGEPTPYKWPNINSHFGILDMCGFPKNIYYYYKSWWTNDDVLHISPHWNWKGKEGKPIDVWVNSNADEVELFLNNKSLGKKIMPKDKHLNWTVNYEPGILKAVAVKKGKQFSTTVETTDDAVTIVAEPSKKVLMADGKDAVVVNIKVLDAKGREVPTANNLIQFNIEGAGKIIGVGNGDPSSHEKDKCEEGAWQRSLFSGKCQIILQAGTTNALIKLKAGSVNLQTETVTIQQVKQ